MSSLFVIKEEYGLSRNEKMCFGILIALGIFFRVFHFLYNRSLWMDEVYLSTSLIKLNYSELATQPLAYEQKAPLGFLWTVKLLVQLFGSQEQGLRLLSLLSGLLSLFVFVPISRYFLRPTGAIIALGILALAPPLIFHAVEIKQYQTELLASLIALYLYIRYQNQESWTDLVTWGIAGALMLWFSYSSIFILGGIACAHSLVLIYKRNWVMFFKQIVPFLLWLISFAINFLLFTHKHAESAWIVYWFDFYHTFMPIPPSSVQDFKWYAENLYHVIDYPLGLNWTIYAGAQSLLKILLKGNWLVLLLLAYGISMFATRSKNVLLMLFPFLLTFTASGLKLYPLVERFWVFLSPLLILFIAMGAQEFYEYLKRYRMQLLIPFLLLGAPLYASVQFVRHPDELILHKRSFQRQAMTYIGQHFKAGDVVYVYWDDLPGFRLYQSTYSFPFKTIEGGDYRNKSSDLNNYISHLQQDFSLFKGKKRVWFIYNVYYRTDIGDRVDEPSWYYKKDNNSTTAVLRTLSLEGRTKIVFKSFDVNISLMELKSN
jgi:hypothetical protein